MMRIAVAILSVALWGCSDRNPHRSGTIDGPLSGDRAIPTRASGGERLADVGNEGLRVLIAPSFGRYAYYFSLRRQPTGCIARARLPHDVSAEARACGASRVHVRRIDQFDRTVAASHFFLPPEESDAFFEELDLRLSRWKGSNYGGTDGTGIEVERVSAGRVTSMSSNASAAHPDNPAAQVSGDLHRILLAYDPSGFAPRSYNWDVREAGDTEDPCNNQALATPLDRGFGIGNSDCDAAKRWPS